MAKNPQVNLDITATDKASKVLDDVADDVKKLDKAKADVGITADDEASKVIKDVKADVDVLNKEDVKITLQAKADALQAELKQVKADLADLDGKTAQVKIEADASKATEALDDINEKAPSSVGALRDVAGGMQGVSTSGLDMAESLLGVGETLGQLNPKLAQSAEQLAKAGFQAGVIMLALSFLEKGYDSLTDTLTDVEAKQTALNASLAAGDIAQAARDVHDLVEEAQRATFFDFAKNMVKGIPGMVKGIQQIPQILDDAKAREEQFNKAMKEGTAQAAVLLEAFRSSPLPADEVTKYAEALREAQEAQAFAAKTAKQAAADQDVLNRAVDLGVDITGRDIKAIEKDVKAREQVASASEHAADTVEKFAETMRGTNRALREAGDPLNVLEGRLSNFNRLLSESGVTDQIEANSRYEASIDSLNETLKENGAVLDLSEEKGRKNYQAIIDTADAIKTGLNSQLKESLGDYTAVEKSAKAYTDELRRQLKQAGFTSDEIENLIFQMGLTPDQIETTIKLNKIEEAKTQLGLLQTAIENLPKEVQTTIAQKIVTGDYVGALQTVQDYYNRHPAKLPVLLVDSKGRPIGNINAPGIEVPGGRSIGPAAAPSVGLMAAAPAGSVGASARAVVPINMNFHIEVRADRTTDTVSLGKAIVGAIQSYERMAGAQWRR